MTTPTDALTEGEAGQPRKIADVTRSLNLRAPFGPYTPASAGAVGTAGTIVWDENYVYVCVATDTWKRVAIATW
jgi:hypothetical protein